MISDAAVYGRRLTLAMIGPMLVSFINHIKNDRPCPNHERSATTDLQ